MSSASRGGVAVFEQRLGEYVMELQAVLTARMVQGNGRVAAPVLGARCAEGQEHGLEQCAGCVPPALQR